MSKSIGGILAFGLLCLCTLYASTSRSNSPELKFPESSILEYADVVSQVEALGGIEIGLSEYTPLFSGYEYLRVYEMPDEEIVAIYAWSDTNSDDFMDASDNCNKIYYANGDCKDKGTACDVTIENGKTIITHCPPSA